MKNEYDFSNAKKNPYVAKIKKQVTIRLDSEVIKYFKNLSASNDIPYQSLINLYLRDCIQKNKKPHFEWTSKK
ncbi:MAG TPA: BrnA antitoxin family protein [Gammaproteobacteria bacterium]|nr:BrnA antitoxin family protein [Gammaproteobacteria bacterium]